MLNKQEKCVRWCSYNDCHAGDIY